jgi:hypothetical protein
MNPRTIRYSILASLSAGFALVMATVGAQAFSDKAVSDAQRLADFMTKLNQGGTASQSQLAQARYNLLYVRLRAGQLAHAEFCKDAKPELTIVADRFEEDDGQKGLKQKWQREIDTMTTSRAACDRAAATAEVALFGSVDRVYSPEEARGAENRAKLAEQRVANGTMSNRELLLAQYEALAARYGARQISLKTYCGDALPKLQSIADVADQDLRAGRVSIENAILDRRNVYRLEATCRSK